MILLRYYFLPNGHFARKNTKILAATESEKPCSLIAEALAARYTDIGCVNRFDKLGRHRVIWLDMATSSHNKGMLDHPGVIKMIILQGLSYNLDNIVTFGKAFVSRSSQERLRASTAQAMRLVTCNTN